MKVDDKRVNLALKSLFKNPHQLVTLDANFIIPPHRKGISERMIPFSIFKTYFLEPLFEILPKLAIHEAVIDELVSPSIKTFIKRKISDAHQNIIVLKDSDLNENEVALRNSIEKKVFPYTNYDPLLNNREDRGEVKTLAYIATKGFLYFATHDFNTIQLVEKSTQLSTGLENVQIVKMYEIIFSIYNRFPSVKDKLRTLYKYQYYLTRYEKYTNYGWRDFIIAMNDLYSPFIDF